MDYKITIHSEGWSETELEEIENIFESHDVKRRSLAQFDAGISVGIIIIVSMFGGAILSGIGNSIGKDIWDKLKSKFSTRAKNNKHSTIGFVFKNGEQKVQLNIKTENPEIIEKAFSIVDKTLEKIIPNEKNISLYFDPKTETWSKIEDKKFMRKFSHAVANTDVVEQGDKKYRFTKESLENGAKTSVGLPVTLGHGGKQIGEVTKSWMNSDVLMHEIGIYEGTSDEDLKELERIISSGGGLSMGVSFDPNDQG